MRQIFLLLWTLLFAQCMTGQQKTVPDTIPSFFGEIKEAAQQHYGLWNRNLYGAILLVDPQTRQVFANESDSEGRLQRTGYIYTGILADNVIISNTSMEWSGKKWAMIMLPLPYNKQDRISLLAHESFHRVQSSLGFILYNTANNHLDQQDGRIYLRLELEALKKAVQAPSERELRHHLTNALTFRKYRHTLYAGSDTTENQLELNEGIAEYTGQICGGRVKNQVAYWIDAINRFFTNPTFVRSFAYYTIPVYGYLLYDKNRQWNHDITSDTNLTDYFIKAFGVRIPEDVRLRVMRLSGEYNGTVIVREEAERDKRTKENIAKYKRMFIEQPHLEIQFDKVNVSFDPRNIVPIEDKGTVYPTIRVSDLWGVLSVSSGALMSPNWQKISVTNPALINGNTITGNGWTLELTDKYTVVEDSKTGNYRVVKK